MARLNFVSWEEMKRRARELRRKKLTSEEARAKTGRLPAQRNPGGGFMKRVVEAAKEFKRKHGGQAYGWAADQASMAPAGEKRRFWSEVTSLLKRDLYATNPKRYSRQTRKGSLKYAEFPSTGRRGYKVTRAAKMLDQHGYHPWLAGKTKRRSKKWLRSYKKWDRVNPLRSENGYCPICSRAYPDGSTTEHVALGERPSKRFCFRKEFGRDTNCDRIAKGLRANPKRDGTPTRGEKRKDKYKDHLRALRERGAKAADELNKLLGRGAHRPHSEPVLKAPTTATQLEHPGHYAAEESSDQKFAKEQLSQVEALMADVRSQMKDLDDADEALADELSDQLIKLGSQRKALQERAKGAVMTNPRRRNPRYTSPARYRKMNTAAKARYRRALRLLRSTVHSI